MPKVGHSLSLAHSFLRAHTYCYVNHSVTVPVVKIIAAKFSKIENHLRCSEASKPEQGFRKGFMYFAIKKLLVRFRQRFCLIAVTLWFPLFAWELKMSRLACMHTFGLKASDTEGTVFFSGIKFMHCKQLWHFSPNSLAFGQTSLKV